MILSKAIRKYGADMQQVIAIEEMAELTKELCKYKRGQDNFDHIAEEIADVEIMMEQLKIMFNAHEEVDTYKAKKLKRLEERLNLERNK